MNPADVLKATKIADLLVLVGQVIRHLKCCRILANEMAINQSQYADDLLNKCEALSIAVQ